MQAPPRLLERAQSQSGKGFEPHKSLVDFFTTRGACILGIS